MGTVVVYGNTVSLGRLMVGLVAGLVLILTLTACGGKDRSATRERMLAAEDITSIGVNAYLWRGALETLDFMPMLQADPGSGVIITDWQVNPSDSNQRSKVTVYILDKQLRADAIKVSVFKQTRGDDEWVDVPGTRDAEREIQEAIMVQARRIHLQQVP